MRKAPSLMIFFAASANFFNPIFNPLAHADAAGQVKAVPPVGATAFAPPLAAGACRVGSSCPYVRPHRHTARYLVLKHKGTVLPAFLAATGWPNRTRSWHCLRRNDLKSKPGHSF